jgi:biopolymer transport protein ExbD
VRRNRVFSREERSAPGAIDLTPMLDVVFIMLIFFIVTASFIEEAGIEVDRPGAVTAEQQKSTRILVAVSAGDQVWIAGRQADRRALRREIERLRAANPRSALVVQADAHSSAKAVAAVLDAARAAGIDDVSLSTRRN